jgi:hypothetical protein
MKISDSIKSHIENISFPRRAGTEGEQKASNYIFSFFKDTQESYDNITLARQPFAFTSGISKLLFGVVSSVFLSLFFINVFFLMMYENSIFHIPLFLSSCFLIYFLFTGIRWNSFIEYIIGMKSKNMTHSSNIIFKIDNNATKNLIFSAHYDTKSGTAGFLSRMVLGSLMFIAVFLVSFYFVIFSLMLLFADKLALPCNLTLEKINFGILILAFIISSITLLSYFQKSGNESPGVFDNASGVAVVMELAKHFIEKPVQNLNIWFLFTSAEEDGLIGMVNFIKTYEKELDKNSTYFINLDGVCGEGKIRIIPHKHSKCNLEKILEKSSINKEIDHSVSRYTPGILFDSVPVSFRGYQAVSIARCSFDKTLWSIHSKHDNLSNICEQALEDTFRLCKKVAKEL